MEQNTPSRGQLIQELENLRSRVRDLERLNQDRERVEEELRMSEERFKAIVQASPLAIIAMDSGGGVTLWNPAAERTFGWSEEETLGKPQPYVTEEMRQEHLAMRTRAFSGEAFSGVEVRRYKKDGSPIDLSVFTAPLRDSRGNIYGVMSVNEDITERNKPEVSRSRLNTILERTTDLVSTYTPDGRLTYLNQAGRKMLGWGKEEALDGRGIMDLHPTWAMKRIESEGLPAAKAIGFWEIETALLHRNGREIPVSQVILAHRSAAGALKYFSTIMRDITERKRLETALRESEERMSQALRAANAGAWEWKMLTNEAIWSDENYLVLGLEPGSVKPCYESWIRTVHPEDRAEADRHVSEAVRNRSDLDISFRVVWPDGSIHWINDRGKLVFEESGEPLGMYGIQIDITARKRAEEALRASEDKYRSIVEQTAEWIWEMDLNGVHTFSNPAIVSIMGYRPEEFIGRTVDSLLHPEDRAEVKANLPRLMEAKRGWRGWNLRLRHKDGSYRFLESNADPILDSSGHLQGYRGADRDITERRGAEELLRKKEEYYRSLFENAMDIVTIMRSDGTILFNSPSLERLVGYKPEELVGRDAFTLMHPQDVGPTREIFERLVRNPDTIETAEFRFQHRDGGWRIFEAVGKNLLQLPAVGAIVVNLRDVTDRRIVEEQLRISLQEKDTLLREIHHRVKNNLQVISSLLDLQSSTVRNFEGIEALRESKQRVKAMAMIHERLYQTGDVSSIVLKGYIEDLVHGIVQANIKDQLVVVQLDVPAIPLNINSAVPCGLIINELVSNCLKHAFAKGQKGHIAIEIRSSEEKRLTLMVEDDGQGLPEDVDIDKKRSLGLTLVRVLVKQLDGTITVQRGAGTRFEITFSDKS